MQVESTVSFYVVFNIKCLKSLNTYFIEISESAKEYLCNNKLRKICSKLLKFFKRINTILENLMTFLKKHC